MILNVESAQVEPTLLEFVSGEEEDPIGTSFTEFSHNDYSQDKEIQRI